MKSFDDAICTVPPGPVRLVREGYGLLGGPKDLKIGSPISSVAVTDSGLKEQSRRDQKSPACGAARAALHARAQG